MAKMECTPQHFTIKQPLKVFNENIATLFFPNFRHWIFCAVVSLVKTTYEKQTPAPSFDTAGKEREWEGESGHLSPPT